MIQPVALTGAALRVMRTVAGRRVLQVVLLVGGLVALGFLCGEQAQAADGVAPAPVTEVSSASAGGARSLTSGAVAGVTHTPAEAAPARQTVTGHSAAETAVKLPALSGVVPDSPSVPDVPALPDVPDVPALPDVPDVPALPAPDCCRQDVPDVPALPDAPSLPDLADLSKLPPLASLPPHPSLPSLPSQPTVPSGPTLPSTSTLPGLPQLPGTPSVPAHTLTGAVTPAPQSGSPTAPTTTDGQTPDGRADAAKPLTHGPRFTPGSDVTGVGPRPPAAPGLPPHARPRAPGAHA